MIVATVKKYCFCVCHPGPTAPSGLGDAAEMRHWGRTASAYALEQESFNAPTGVRTSDYVAAVFACESCRSWHVAVLFPSAQTDGPWDDNNPPSPPKPASGVEGEGDE